MTDWRAWVGAHKVCWEIEPLREHVEGHGVQQTGYELRLFGRLDHLGEEEDGQAARLRVHHGLRELALDVLASFPEPHALVQLRPFDQSVHLWREGSFVAEIELAIVVYPRHPAQPMTPAEAQSRIAAVEAKLRALGLHESPRARLSELASAPASRSRA